MMWLCRAGKNAEYISRFLSESRIYLPWDGYAIDMSCVQSRNDFRTIVVNEKNPTSSVTVSNWSGQLFSFCREMRIGEHVLIPHRKSKSYVLSVINGNYEYIPSCNDCLLHSRKISIVEEQIPGDIFSQSIRYSLGAYRTLFKVRDEKEVLSIIEGWRKVR